MKKFLMALAVVSFMVSCDKNDDTTQMNQQMEQIDYGKAISLGLKSTTFGLDKPSTYTFKDQEELDVLITEISREIESIELVTFKDEKGIEYTEQVSFGLVISPSTGTLTLNPTPIVTIPVNEVTGDEDCGKGEGWKKYGTCLGEKCVENKIRKASADLKANDMSPGQCFETRVRRVKAAAYVCARIIAC